jgi:hypothetical protein
MMMYLSRMTTRLSDEEIEAIAKLSAVNNVQRDVTGMLVKVGNHFLQVIEGSDVALESLMTKLSKDPRHTEIQVIDNRHVDDRLFGKWNMAFFNADERDTVGVDEFDELRNGIHTLVDGYVSRPYAMQQMIGVIPVMLARYAVAAHFN